MIYLATAASLCREHSNKERALARFRSQPMISIIGGESSFFRGISSFIDGVSQLKDSFTGVVGRIANPTYRQPRHA
jgi:hypothetical protein